MKQLYLLLMMISLSEVMLFAEKSKKDQHSSQPVTKTAAVQSNSVQAATIVNRTTQYQLPANLVKEAQGSKVSILTPPADQIDILYKNYPKGAVLFPANNDLASQFDDIVLALQANPKLISFMRKIVISTLNNIYDYFVKIYTNFNLTHPGANRSNGTISTDVNAFYQDEQQYQTTVKKLLMSQYLNLIEAQFNQSIVSYVPSTPNAVATPLGKLFIANDFTINLDDYLTPQNDDQVMAQQQANLNFMNKYLSFMQNYTQYLSQIDPATGLNQFVSLAQGVTKYLSNKKPAMNPGMFFYDQESLRALQFIPATLGIVSSASQPIPWAPDAVNAATQNLMLDGQQAAYFTAADGSKTTDVSQAQKLFVRIPTGPNLFEQELLAQPTWLQSSDGMLKILSACLGNCGAILDMDILDDSLEKVIKKIVATTSNDDIPPPPPSIPIQKSSKSKSKK